MAHCKTTKTADRLPKYVRWILPLLILLLVPTSFALTIFTSYVHKEDTVGSGVYENEEGTLLNLTVTQDTLTFGAAGDEIDISLDLTNRSEANISYYYELNTTAPASQTAAILVFLDGKYIDTLAHLCQTGRGMLESENYILAADDTGDSHTLTFRLHISAPEEYLNTPVPVTVTTYTKNINYRKYLLVGDEDAFAKAVADVNSGMLESDPVIVLTSPLTLTGSYTFTKPATINLYGNVLECATGATLTFSQEGSFLLTSSRPLATAALSSAAGSLILDGASAVLDIGGFEAASRYGNLVNPVSYDTDAATALVRARFDAAIGKGIRGGESRDVLSGIGFYPLFWAAGNGYSCTNGILTADVTDLTHTEPITVGSETLYFRIMGSDDTAIYLSLLENELAHLEQYNAVGYTDVVMNDLFLPTSVREKNVSIVWRSDKGSMVDESGQFSDSVVDNEQVTLYAEIRVNDTLFEHSFTFRVSNLNNRTKFSNLVANIHPFLYNVYKESYGENERYFLPVADETSGYDYRKDYTTLYSPESGNHEEVKLTWDAYADIGLVSMKYIPNTVYSYVTLENNNELYLNVPTFNTFAQLKVQGQFEGDDEIYEETINVTIELGVDNDELYDLIFSEVESRLNAIDVLQNILDTRVAHGMQNERGDFWMPDNYMSFHISYSIPSSSAGAFRATAPDGTGFLHDEENQRYHIGVNAAGFTSQESRIAINVTVTPPGENMGNYAKDRLLYVRVPAIIRPDTTGFANLGVFDSVKYQVFTQLDENERNATNYTADTALTGRLSELPPVTADYSTGFVLSGTTLTNRTGAYILKYDSDRTRTLSLIVGETAASVNAAENHVYLLAELLEWATGAGTGADPVNGTVKADGREFLHPSEVQTIKNYFMSVTGISDADWTTLWNSVARQAPGYVITDGASLNAVIQGFDYTDDQYFKHLELMQWMTDQINWDEGDYKCPNMGTVGARDWDMSDNPTSGNAHTSTQMNPDTVDQWASDGNWSITDSKIHTNPYYKDDDTTYLSDAEVQILLTFHLNVNETNGKKFAKAFFNYATVPTNLMEGAVERLVLEMYALLKTSPVGFTSAVQNGVPMVSNLDGITAGMSNFGALISLTVRGEMTTSGSVMTPGQPAFVQTTSLASFYNRITSQGTKTLTDLVMQNCAGATTVFDITNTANLKALKRFDISYNKGVGAVGTLVDLPMAQIEYLDIYGVSVDPQFFEYPLSNLRAKAPGAELWYDKDGIRTNYQGSATVAEVLTYLKEIGEIRGNYLQLCQQLISSGASSPDRIIWRIESGNPMTLVTDPGLPEIRSIAEMERMAANYYYCTGTFTYGGMTMEQGRIYYVAYDGAKLTFTDFGYDIQTVLTEPDAPDSSSATQSSGYTFDGTPETGAMGELISSTTGGSGYFLNSNTRYYVYGISANSTTATRLATTRIRCIGYTGTTTNTYRYVYTATGLYDESWTLNIPLTRYCIDASGNLTRYEYTTYVISRSGATYTYETTATVKTYTGVYWSATQNATGGTTINTGTYIGVGYRSLSSQTINITNLTRTYYFEETTVSAYSSTAGTWETTGTSTADPAWETPASSVVLTGIQNLATPADAKAVADHATAAATGNLYYRYTGTTGSGTFYNNRATRSTMSFTNGSVYRLTVTPSGFAWVNSDLTLTAQAPTMDSILAAAKALRGDPRQILYYGNYYFYNGPTVTYQSADGETRTYVNGHVYRLFLDASGEFFFEDTGKTCSVVTTKDGFLGKLPSYTEDNIGDFMYLSAGDNTAQTYAGYSFYEVTYNSETGSYFIKTFTDISVSLAESDSIYRLHNDRVYDNSGGQNLYGGTGGSRKVILSATVVIDGVEYTRLFDVSVIG